MTPSRNSKHDQHAWYTDVRVKKPREGVFFGPLFNNALSTQNSPQEVCKLIWNKSYVLEKAVSFGIEMQKFTNVKCPHRAADKQRNSSVRGGYFPLIRCKRGITKNAFPMAPPSFSTCPWISHTEPRAPPVTWRRALIWRLALPPEPCYPCMQRSGGGESRAVGGEDGVWLLPLRLRVTRLLLHTFTLV